MSLRRLDWVVTFYLTRRHRWTDLGAGITRDTAFAACWIYYSWYDCNKKRKWKKLFAVLLPVVQSRIKKKS